jgi:hypothetical protein
MSSVEKRWVSYSNEIDAFLYGISIPVNQDNWMEIILEFDLQFLKIGRKYGLFYYDFCIEKDYKKRRLESFYTNHWRGLAFLRFEHYFSKSDFELFKKTFIDIPEYSENGSMSTKRNKFDLQFYTRDNDLISFVSNDGPMYDELIKLTKWETKIHLALISHSNIWWEEIGFTIGPDKLSRIVLNPPINNRPWAYNITPRFNSFLRDLKNISIDLGGSFHLDKGSFVKKYVSEDGILLDGKVFFFEDNINYHSS